MLLKVCRINRIYKEPEIGPHDNGEGPRVKIPQVTTFYFQPVWEMEPMQVRASCFCRDEQTLYTQKGVMVPRPLYATDF